MKPCECQYHRYHVVHVCGCGKLHSHSQADCDAHRRCTGESITLNSDQYVHGDTADDVRRKAERTNQNENYRR